jgi:hypothetical protein
LRVRYSRLLLQIASLAPDAASASSEATAPGKGLLSAAMFAS